MADPVQGISVQATDDGRAAPEVARAGSTTVLTPAPPPARPAPTPGGARAPMRLPVLDGWRAISILCILACHMLPLGPAKWDLNSAAGIFGMSLFFTLSGFLITVTLEAHRTVAGFLVRRLCRIVPLAYLYMVVVVLLVLRKPECLPSHLAFTFNYDTEHMTVLTHRLWSLCVEVHFYLFMALLMGLTRFRGHWGLVAALLTITGVRIYNGAHVSIFTHLRVDEILAGACLALVYLGRLPRLKAMIHAIPLPLLLVFLIITSYPACGAASYLRPYAAAMMVGHTVFRSPEKPYRWLTNPIMGYLAGVSYAVFVFHSLSTYGWLDRGSSTTRYILKRPLSFAITFGLAHLSTRYWERPWIAWGKRVSQRLEAPASVGAPAAV